mgnify:CR=1 FL=1
MNLCNDHHEEVCYECRNCPACDAREEVELHQKEEDRLRKRLRELGEDE